MKYIDAEKLRKEVKRLEKTAYKSALGCADSETRRFHEGKDFAYQQVSILIDTLQQEQQEMDLEREIEEYRMINEWSESIPLNLFKVIARYFYGLGQLNSK